MRQVRQCRIRLRFRFFVGHLSESSHCSFSDGGAVPGFCQYAPWKNSAYELFHDVPGSEKSGNPSRPGSNLRISVSSRWLPSERDRGSASDQAFHRLCFHRADGEKRPDREKTGCDASADRESICDGKTAGLLPDLWRNPGEK